MGVAPGSANHELHCGRTIRLLVWRCRRLRHSTPLRGLEELYLASRFEPPRDNFRTVGQPEVIRSEWRLVQIGPL